MKTILLAIILLLPGMLAAQTIDNPPFKVRSGSLFNITRIERTPETTKLYIHAIFRPHWWIKVNGSNYLEDAKTGKRYPFQKIEGIELNKEVYMPDSGTMDFVIYFAPLAKETTSIHWIDPSDTESDTFDISLVSPKKQKTSPLKEIKGNWFNADSNQWEYGIYDSISIVQNRIYTNENIRKKGKRIELTIKDKKNGNTATLLLTPQKDGNCLMQINGANTQICTRDTRKRSTVATETDFKQFLRKDTAYLQGYIDGYDPRLGFETGLVYMENTITGESYPTVATINRDGTFEAKLSLNHPIEQFINLKNINVFFYVEPGQTLTIYLDWEAVLEYNRSRNFYSPIRNIAYMGPSSTLSQMYQALEQLIYFPYNQLSSARKEFTPKQFKEKMQPVFQKWNQLADSLAHIYRSDKATHLLKNKIALQKGSILFDFLMGRDQYAKQDTTNQALKVKEEDSYYDFLKEIPLNDEVLLADNQCHIFDNRFNFMNPLHQAIYPNFALAQPDSIDFNYPTPPILSFLKKNGVKLTSELEELAVTHEKLAGKTVKRKTTEVKKEIDMIAALLQANKNLAEAYKKIALDSLLAKKTVVILNEERERTQLKMSEKRWTEGGPTVQRLSGQANSFFWQISLVLNLSYELQRYKTQKVAQEYFNLLKAQLTHPTLIAEAEQIWEKVHPSKEVPNHYQLPECKATEIFRNIIKAHSGKVLFVDFWATSCGPCRSGIEKTADLREKYKNHPEFQFIYITSKTESPQEVYEKYVEKNMKGEASYRIGESEFNYLRELFRFNGIPHYELIEKDGSVALKSPTSWDLKEFLDKRFGTHSK